MQQQLTIEQALQFLGALFGAGALAGGMLVKLFDFWLARRKQSLELTQFVTDALHRECQYWQTTADKQREQIAALDARVQEMADDLDIWKAKAEQLEHQVTQLLGQIELLQWRAGSDGKVGKRTGVDG